MYTEEKKLTQEEISWRQFNKYVKTALIRKRKDYLQKKARIMKHEMPQDPETILLYKYDRRNDRDFEALFQDDTDILTLDIENKRLQQALNCLNQREYYVVITYNMCMIVNIIPYQCCKYKWFSPISGIISAKSC